MTVQVPYRPGLVRVGAQRMTARTRAEQRLAWLLLLPSLGLLAALSIYPLIDAGLLSFRIENLFNPAASHFGGWRNYTDLFADPFFRRSLFLTLEWTIAVVTIQLLLGLFLAFALDRTTELGGILRTLFTIPVFISPIAMGLTWRFMFEPTTGVVNWVLIQFGLSPLPWLSGRPRLCRRSCSRILGSGLHSSR